MTEDHDQKWKRRWRDDCRILTITAAPPGWWALFRKQPDEITNPEHPTIHDLAWVEPIACFALIEEVQRLQLLYGEDKWETTGMTDADEARGWPHTRVVPVPWHSGEQHFPGADELTGFRAPWDYIVRPPDDLNATWIVNQFRPEAKT